MSARVVRMLNGEDVIADVKEVREKNDGPALAYKLTQPYTVTIQQPPEVTFETDEATGITDFNSQFMYPSQQRSISSCPSHRFCLFTNHPHNWKKNTLNF